MKKFFLMTLLSLTLVQCKNADLSESTDVQETAQQIGDVMASIDEAGGSSGTIANNQIWIEKTFNRHAPGQINRSLIADLFQPKAHAASCEGFGFEACSGSSITRDFAGCTVGSAVFTGTTTLTWGGAATACSITGPGGTITRIPNFTVTGRRGATLTVSKTGTIGQRLTWDSGTGADKVFSFSNDGINRKFTANSTTLFNQTSATTSPITISGTSRTNRVMNGGVLQVINHMNGVTCNFAPTNVAWTAGCNCPTSGSWTGTCSNSNTSTLTLTGCGTATYAEGSFTESVTLDRCGT